MKLYCTHPLKYWNMSKKIGYLKGNKDYYMFPEPYEWLMKQMEDMLPNYKKEDSILWLWPKKPNLKKGGYTEPDELAVLLEIELDEKDVLFSDYLFWHNVLNDYQIELYDDEVIDKEESWKRIFDEGICKKLKKGYNCSQEKQATTGIIPLSKVKLLKVFSEKYVEEDY